MLRNKASFYGEYLLAPLPTPNLRTTPCLLSATAYSIYSQLPYILEAVPPSSNWGRAMPWWQGPAHEGWTLLYFFIPLWTLPTQARVTWSASAALLHIWIQSPRWNMGKVAPVIFELPWLNSVRKQNCNLLNFHWHVNERLKNCDIYSEIYFSSQHYVLNNLSKWSVFTLASVHTSTPIQVSSRRNANQNAHEIVSSTKIAKLRALKGKEKPLWRVYRCFASHPKEERESQT